MKKLEDLGLSPLPWHALEPTRKEVEVIPEKLFMRSVAKCRGPGRTADALLIETAPVLYEVVYDMLFGESGGVNCAKCSGADFGKCDCCPLGKARAALEKACGMRNSDLKTKGV